MLSHIVSTKASTWCYYRVLVLCAVLVFALYLKTNSYNQSLNTMYFTRKTNFDLNISIELSHNSYH